MTVALPIKERRTNNFGDDKDYVYTFVYDDREVEVVAQIFNAEKMIQFVFAVEGDIDTTGKIGVGSIRIFATVAHIIRTMHKLHSSYGISFSAKIKEYTRVSLYRKFANRIAKELNGTYNEAVQGVTIVFTIVPNGR